MDSIDRRDPPSPGPQLGRECYNVDSSSDDNSDSDSSSLLVLSPVQKVKKVSENSKRTTAVLGNCHSSDVSDKDNETGTKMAPRGKSPAAAKTTISKRIGSDSTNTFPCFDSDSDSDFDEMFLRRREQAENKPISVKQPIAARKKTPQEDLRQRKKRDREGGKIREKLDRERRRKEVRDKKERLKQIEKKMKKRQTEEHNQSNGKYSHEEIAVLLDTELYRNDPYRLVETLSKNFVVHRFPSQLQTSNMPTLVKAIQFIRKEKLKGGAENAVVCLESDCAKGNLNAQGGDRAYDHIDYLAVLFEPDDFIPLLQRDACQEEDDYPALELWLNTIRSQWQRIWCSSNSGKEPNIIFLLYDLPGALDKKWLEYRRNNSNARRNEASLPTVKELQDAALWLLVRFQVECIMCPNIEFLQSSVHKMARGLSDRPYVRQVTELECIKKIKQGCTDTDDPLEKAKDVWLRMLQQLPGLSEARAQHIVEHFPTCQSLWQAYQWEHYDWQEGHYEASECLGTAEGACASLLEDKFSNDNRRHAKLSEIVYRVLTSDNPNEMVL